MDYSKINDYIRETQEKYPDDFIEVYSFPKVIENKDCQVVGIFAVYSDMVAVYINEELSYTIKMDEFQKKFNI